MLKSSLLRLLVLLPLIAACKPAPPPRPPRFIFKAFSAEPIITVDGKLVQLEPSGYDGTFRGMIDMPEGTVEAQVKPKVRVPSPCGEVLLKLDRWPPNESNVVQIDIGSLPTSTMDLAVDPAAQDVKVGSESVPAGKKRMTIYNATCAFDVSVGAQKISMSAPPPSTYALLVSASPGSCYNTGVAAYAPPGKDCGRDRRATKQGALAYWLDHYAFYPFMEPETSVTVTKKDCEFRGFITACR